MKGPSFVEGLADARRIGTREAFHRRVFEILLNAASDRRDLELGTSVADGLRESLARWIVEAPVADDRGPLRLLAARRPLRALLRACGHSTGEFLRQVLGVGNVDPADAVAFPPWKRSKLALLGDASFWTPVALDVLRASDPALAQLAAIGSLDLCTLDAELSVRTEALGRWLMEHPSVDLPPHCLPILQDTAFFVSYLAVPERHAFKRALVRQARFMLHRQAPAAAAEVAKGGGRPRLTIVGELLFPAHAMFRCYAEALGELLSHFEVTLVADEPTRCPEHATISHRQHYFPAFERDVNRLAALVRNTRPDIILYPSVGMSFWSFALSLLRLAPLQLMSVGHPAPACSDEIDGVLLYRELASMPLPEYGRLLAYDRQPLPATPREVPMQRLRADSRPPVVAVNAAGIKLNPLFLAALDGILRRAPTGTELHFFPNAPAIELLALRRELRQRWPQAQVHASAAYADYMTALARADLVLQSFPFGGTNTVMDALALGIPMVCMRGDDLSARVDPLLLDHAGLGELCADDLDGYFERAVGLLTDTARRARLSELARQGPSRLATLQHQGGAGSLADAILECWQARP